MTETERKALALVNEVEDALRLSEKTTQLGDGKMAICLRRAIEQHERFRQEVSDAVADVIEELRPTKAALLSRFIIAKPDPLVEVMQTMIWSGCRDVDADTFRAAIEERGGKIVWGEG